MPATDPGARAAARLAGIAGISEPGPGVTRLPFTPTHRAALDVIGGWMRQAGLAVSLDAAGTLVGRLDGPPGAPVLLMGSHQDSVREGGAFDGIMGVLLPILALQELRARETRLPFAVEVLAFADEEGVRFPTALMGPRALAGTFDAAVLDLEDRGGTSLGQAMRDFGLDPDRIGDLRRAPGSVLGFVETHIEQGPVLELAGQALGVVTAISGIERHLLTLTGVTGHAGTMPMTGRRDALVGGAEIVLWVNRFAGETPDLRGTVGAFDVAPNVVNAVPGQVTMTVEFRSPDDAVRQSAGVALHDFASATAARLGLTLDARRTYAQPAQPCDAALSGLLRDAVSAAGGQGLTLPSGATHDASAMADLCPIAMLFVRCRGGLSHVPEEFASAEDMAAAVRALVRFLGGFA